MDLYEDEDTERANFYRLFSALFLSEPDVDLLVQFGNVFGLTITNTLDEVGTDFLQLFSDSSGHLPPYESLYNYDLPDTPRLWGKVTEEVQRLYHANGLMIDEEIDLIPDHLSAELLFMAYLIESGTDEVKESFLRDHIISWVGYYCDEIAGFAQTDFYVDASALLKEFISVEAEELGTGTAGK